MIGGVNGPQRLGERRIVGRLDYGGLRPQLPRDDDRGAFAPHPAGIADVGQIDRDVKRQLPDRAALIENVERHRLVQRVAEQQRRHPHRELAIGLAQLIGPKVEIEGVRASCTYKGDEPIRLRMQVGFGLGRGPQAAGWSNTYRYWVAVTLRNRTVLAKQYFDVKADFTADTDRVLKVEHIDDIVIPRATATVNGSNFEVLVGFDVTPEMAAFNRDGKRFRMNAFDGGKKPSVAAGDPQPK